MLHKEDISNLLKYLLFCIYFDELAAVKVEQFSPFLQSLTFGVSLDWVLKVSVFLGKSGIWEIIGSADTVKELNEPDINNRLKMICLKLNIKLPMKIK